MQRIAIVAPRLFDGIDTVLTDGAALVWENGKIIYAGKPEGMPEVDPPRILKYDDATLLPGLIDAHVHLTMDGSADPVRKTVFDSIPTASFRAMNSAEQHIRMGVTTVRDCGSQEYVAVHLSAAVRDGLIVRAPRIVACGPVICITGGHGAFVGLETDGPIGVRQAVRTVLKNGADFIKIITTGGVLTKGTDAAATQMAKDEVEAAVEAAGRAGVRVTTHAHAAEGVKLALRAGVNSIDHASYVDNEILDLFHQTGAYYVPTLIASICQMDHIDEIPAHVAEKIRKHIDREVDGVRRLIAAKVPIAAGTDGGTPFNRHGNLPAQLALLHRYGLAHIDALRAGTSGSAEAMGISGTSGSLRLGMSADVLLVRGDPTNSLNDLQNVLGVWREGIRLVDTEKERCA